MMDYRRVLGDRLRGFREWAEARDPRRFSQVLFVLLLVSVTAIIASNHLGGDEYPSGRVLAGVALFVFLELWLLFAFLRRLEPEIAADNHLMVATAALFLGFCLLARLFFLPAFSPYLIPMAALGMLATVILNLRTALLLVLLQSLNVGLMSEFDLGVTFIVLLVGVFSLLRVTSVSQRTEFLSASFHVMLVSAAAILAAELLAEARIATAFGNTLWGVGNGLLTLVLTLSLLILFETAFNLTTPLRLLELGNPAHPLLRRLMQVAPGTYNHSIMMGNMAEAAAEAVGANALLARVGAYYHDIGKVQRPEYFIENQLHIENPHDKLNPNLSKLAITAHVREGEDMGREFGLPQPIIDIIKQHHGTSVLAYFYHKAREGEHGEEVTEEEYRYEAEKPQSPEAAIIMLADSVEAAARAMRNPTPKKLQGLIGEIIKQKVDDGQLDRSRLTLGDLHRIREVFEAQLWGLLGHRIAYPGDSSVRAGRPRGRLPDTPGGDGPGNGKLPRDGGPSRESDQVPATDGGQGVSVRPEAS